MVTPRPSRGAVKAPPTVSLLDVGAFLGEVALLAALVVAAMDSDGQLSLRLVLAVASPAALALVWGLWLAPRSPHRLPRVGRIALKMMLTLAVAGRLAVVGHPLAAAVLAVLVGTILTAGELGQTGPKA